MSDTGADTPMGSSSVRAAVITAGIGIYLSAALVIAVSANGRIRFTADSAATIPMWHPWLPAAVGVAVALLVPARPPDASDRAPSITRTRVEAAALTALAVAFAVALTLLGPTEPTYTLLKVGLLVLCPLLLIAAGRRRTSSTDTATTVRQRVTWRPWLPVLAWAAAYLALSEPDPTQRLDMDALTLVIALAGGFLLNALVEELFYRKWLQTRWSRVLSGTWPAIIVSALLWASWHIAIQGSGNLVADLSNTVVNQGVTGLFLGLLWARYRVLWPLLITHGVINANPVTLFF